MIITKYQLQGLIQEELEYILQEQQPEPEPAQPKYDDAYREEIRKHFLSLGMPDGDQLNQIVARLMDPNRGGNVRVGNVTYNSTTDVRDSYKTYQAGEQDDTVFNRTKARHEARELQKQQQQQQPEPTSSFSPAERETHGSDRTPWTGQVMRFGVPDPETGMPKVVPQVPGETLGPLDIPFTESLSKIVNEELEAMLQEDKPWWDPFNLSGQSGETTKEFEVGTAPDIETYHGPVRLKQPYDFYGQFPDEPPELWAGRNYISGLSREEQTEWRRRFESEGGSIDPGTGRPLGGNPRWERQFNDWVMKQPAYLKQKESLNEVDLDETRAFKYYEDPDVADEDAKKKKKSPKKKWSEPYKPTPELDY